MYRIDRDESRFTDAQKIAWHIVLPLMYLPILDSDYQKADELAKQLEKLFSKRALRTASDRLAPNTSVEAPSAARSHLERDVGQNGD